MPPYPQLWNQAEAITNQQLQGYLQSAGRQNRKETRRGQKYIRRLAHSFADELGQINAGISGSYDQYQQAMGATDAAIANYLSGQGQLQASDLNAQLAYSPEAQAHVAQQAQATGRGLGQVAAGYSAQNQQQFLGEGASNVAYGKALPGIAALSGIQSAQTYQAQQADEMAQLREQVLSQAPGMVQGLYSSFAAQASAAADRAQQERFHRQDLAASHQGEVGGKLAQAQTDAYTLMSGLTGQINPLTGEPLPGPGYGDLHDRIKSLFEQRFPGRPPGWVEQQVQGVLGQFGFTQQGFLGDISDFVHGIIPQGTGPGVASASGLAAPGAAAGRFGTRQAIRDASGSIVGYR